MSMLNNRITAVVAGSVLVVGLGATGAVAGNMIDSADIRDGSVRPVDLGDGVNSRIQNKATDREISGVEERVTALEAQVAALEAQDQSGVNTNWVANPGSTIDGPNAVTLADTSVAGTSVEIQNLDLPVQATKQIVFTYRPNDSFVFGAGAPRVFVEIGGTYFDTFDATNPGVDNGDGTFTVSHTIVQNGRAGNVGVVNDGDSPGTVTVTDLVISGHPISFQ